MPARLAMPKHLCLERGPSAGAGQQDVRCLVQSLSGQPIALLADVPGPVCLPGLVAAWGEAKVGADGA